MPVFTEKRRYRPIGWKAHHLGYKQGIELETLSSPGEKSGRLFFCGIFPRFFRFSSEGAPFQSRAVGVGITCPSASHCRIDSSRLFRPCFPAQYCPVSVPVVSRKSPENPSGRWDSSLRLSGHGVRINSSISIS